MPKHSAGTDASSRSSLLSAPLFLEGGRELMILKLDEDLCPRDGGEHTRMQKWRANQVAIQTGGCPF